MHRRIPVSLVAASLAAFLAGPAVAQTESDSSYKGPPKLGGVEGGDFQVPGKPQDATTRGTPRGAGYDTQGGMMDAASLEAQAVNGGGLHYHTHVYGAADGYAAPSYVVPPQNVGTFRGNYGMSRGAYGGGYRGGVQSYGAYGGYRSGGAYNRNYGGSTNAAFRARDMSNAAFNPYGMGGTGRMYWSD